MTAEAVQPSESMPAEAIQPNESMPAEAVQPSESLPAEAVQPSEPLPAESLQLQRSESLPQLDTIVPDPDMVEPTKLLYQNDLTPEKDAP